jgi:alpha-tubulin suppressor-like RCC1 family protein
LGDGLNANTNVPTAVVGLADPATQVSAGGDKSVAPGVGTTCALLTTGDIQCWGYNANGQLGDGTTANSNTPVTVVGLAPGATRVSVGGLHTCATFGTTGAECWGANAHGELGDGTTTERHSPTPVSGLTDVMRLTTGDLHTCAAFTTGGAACWGANESGEIGDTTTIDRHTPTPVSGI